MAQTIKLKRSATQGAAPTTSNLALGEVAINTYDGKMYIKKDVGGTESIVEIGGSGADLVSYLEAGMIEYEYTATSSQTTFSGSDNNSATLSYTANSIMVFLNGVLQDDGVDYSATNGTSVVFTSALAANDEVRIVAFTNVTTSGSLQDPTKLDAITTVNAQAAYSLTLNSSAYTPSSQNALIVSLNGITQEPGDSFTISGSTITFSPALVTGDVVDYIVDMGRAVTIGEYSGDLAVGGELEVTGDIIGDLRGATLFKVQAGENLAKGDVVYISGISGNTTVVSKADADDAAKMPAFGLVAATASSGNPVDVYTFGRLSGLDTSSFSEGDELFVSTTAGTLTNSAPTGESSKLQKIAKVTRSDNSAGSVFIMGAGRSNAVPNLDDGDIFIGNASNQAVSASLNTKIEDYLDAGTSTPSFSTINSGNITTTGYIAGPSTFTIDPAAVGDNTGTLVVAGNLQVDGTTTTINSTTMTVDDLNITLASGAANAAAANGAGITVDGASATLTYNGTNDDWNFNKGLNVTGSVKIPAATALIGGASGGDTQLIYWNGTNAYYGRNTLGGSVSQHEFRTGGTTRLTINSSGNVGIGTTSPADELEIEGADPAIRWDDTSAGGYARLEATNGSMVYEADQGNTVGNSTHIFKVDSDEKMRITSSGNVGIGETSPDTRLHVTGTTSDYAILAEQPSGYAGLALKSATVNQTWSFIAQDNGSNSDLLLYGGSSAGTKMTVDHNGNVGIGGSPVLPLTVEGGDIGANGSYRIKDSGGTYRPIISFSSDDLIIKTGTTTGTRSIAFETENTERMRIDSSGNLLVGTTTYNSANEGILLGATGVLYATGTSGISASFGRNTTDGSVVNIRKDNINVGGIGTEGGDSIYIQGGTTGGAGLLCHGGAAKILPVRNGSSIDATIDLGQDSRRFKDLYLSGGAYLGGTGSANYLDDYEEGTWTPVLTGTTSGTKNLAGKYTKIGNKVTIRIGHWSSISSGTINGSVYITGLPFAPANNPWANGAGIASYGLAHIRGQTSLGTANAPWVIIDSGAIRLHDSGNLGNSNAYSGQAATWSAGKLAQNNSTSIIIDWVFTYLTT